jgi:16S rRNA processing protein RimM
LFTTYKNADGFLHRHFFYPVSNMNDYFKAGYISKAHGLKGAVTLVLEQGAEEFLKNDQPLFLQINSSIIPFFIEELHVQNDKALVKLEDVNTAEEAQKLKGVLVFLPKSVRPKSGRGEFDEILGFSVVHENEILGEVIRVENEQINPLIIVFSGEKEIAIPVNAPFIQSVNKTQKRIIVELPDGLLDL